MHPVEHVIYFSTVLIYWVVPSHPIRALFTLLFVALMSIATENFPLLSIENFSL